MKKTLSALIYPRTPDEFFKAYSQNEPFAVHNLNASVSDLLNLSFFSSLENLLNTWPHLIQAHLPDVKDEASSIDTNSRDAQKLFDNKMGLLFNNAHSISPVLMNWLTQLRRDLGLSAQTHGRCLIYATPAQGGTAPHFDQNINFVLQLSGQKKWWLAQNQHIQNPTVRHTMGLPVDPELKIYLDSEMPTQMPPDAKVIELKAGSLLFVPRGYWHSTHAEKESLSLNFTFTEPTWIDLFTMALKTRLLQSAEWRASTQGVSDPEMRILAEQKFELLLEALIEDSLTWRAEDILNSTETDDSQ